MSKERRLGPSGTEPPGAPRGKKYKRISRRKRKAYQRAAKLHLKRMEKANAAFLKSIGM